MYHTVYLTKRLDGNQYSLIYNAISNITKENNKSFFKSYGDEKTSIYVSYLFKEYGLLIYLKHSVYGNNEEQFHYHAIEIRLNPKRLVFKNDYVNVTHHNDYSSISDAFSSILKCVYDKYCKTVKKNGLGMYIRFHRLDEYQLSRIDYCINIIEPYLDIYIDLISKADVPKRFTVVQYYDSVSKRSKPYPHSYCVENNSLCINFYDKRYQLSKVFKDSIDDICPDNVIRFEIQCKYLKVYNLSRKNQLERTLEQLSKEELSMKQILSYYEKTIGIEDYYTINEARELIYNSKYSRDTKELMIDVLKLIAQKRSVWRARASDEIDEDDFKKAIKKIKKMGINPVTIPNHLGISHLPNFLEKIVQEFMTIL